MMRSLLHDLAMIKAALMKTSKASVSYQNEPEHDEWCGKCSMFRKPNACTLVMGHILPEGWCVEYYPKTTKEQER